MGKVKVKDRTMTFINNYNYNKLSSIRRALKGVLKLEAQAQMFGSEGAMIILTDIKSGLDSYSSPVKILTERQRIAINLCLVNDLTEAEAAEKMGVSQQAVNSCILSGVKRIRNYLVTGEMSDPVFTDYETYEVIKFYKKGLKPVEIASLLNKSPRTLRNKIKYLKAIGRL